MARPLDHTPDPFQQQAIQSTARGIRIVAPAGSGKSETLARRIAKRIEQDGIDPRRILVLTFDNAAKKSLTGFFGELLDRRKMPQIRTFNGHGNQILKSYFPDEIAELQNRTSAYAELERDYNSRGPAYEVLTWDGVPRKVCDVFVALKEQGFYPLREGERDKQTAWLRDEYFRVPREGESATFNDYWSMPSATVADDTYVLQIGTLLDSFVQFENELRSANAMGYVDQKARAVQRLYRSSKNIKLLQQEFDEIVVDEGQDISRLDAMLAFYTAGPDALVVLAGDDDQNLYEFRNAQSLYLRRPEIVFSGIEFETIHLNLNYRSPQEILAPAVRLISHNVERLEKSPSSGVMHTGSVDAIAFGSRKNQDDAIVAMIRAEIAAGRAPEDIAILCYPRDDRALKRPLEKLLADNGIRVVETSADEQQVTKPGVWVRSFLKSKGRQWPVVFIPAVNDRDVPDAESVRKGEIEAIRRRFYVAMTRASEKLVFTYLRGGESDRLDLTAEGEVIGTNGASRFLFEAGLVQATEPEPHEVAATAGVVPQPVETDAPSPAPAPEPAGIEQPAPGEPSAPPKRKGKLQPWELREAERNKLAKARAEWDSATPDIDTVVSNTWAPVVLVLTRMLKYPSGYKAPDIVQRIDDAVVQRVVDIDWKDKLHLWRKIRNQASHPEDTDKRYSEAQYKDHAFAMVNEAPRFFQFLEDRHAPKQIALETRDEFVVRLTNLVTSIQQEKPSPISGKPLRALRFDTQHDAYDVLAMQLLMVLRDVRFYVPDEFRWSSTPLISKFAVDAIGHLPEGFRTSQRNLMRLPDGEERNQLLARFEHIVKQEAGDANPGEFLLHRLQDGLALENGNFHAGLKLNPRARV